MKETIKKVEQWFAERQIIENSTPLKQALKTSEEVLELQNAIIDNDLEEIKDAIGDIQVTLIGVCLHKSWDFLSIRAPFNYNYSRLSFQNSLMIEKHINDIKGRIENYKNDGDVRYKLGLAKYYLKLISEQHNLTLEECLQSAYEVISKRKGKMVNGLYIKNEEVIKEEKKS